MKEIQFFNDNLDADLKEKLTQIVHNFDKIEGGAGKRNIIKTLKLSYANLNIKAFKTPNIFNQIAYNFFRKSKAQRSFIYAKRLLSLGVRTPKPLAYFEYKTFSLFKKSFYISEQLDYDITYRELTTDFDIPDYDNILRAFTRFTFKLHEKGIEFLDHSPGNTLIVKHDSDYRFFLVDLNRMRFRQLDFKSRIKNFSRLTKYKAMVEVMSDEYAKCINMPYNKVFDAMWHEVRQFRQGVDRKKKFKKRLGL